nr:MAG TPA: hypothetical protein [Caudoviricetes sp.]
MLYPSEKILAVNNVIAKWRGVLILSAFLLNSLKLSCNWLWNFACQICEVFFSLVTGLSAIFLLLSE